MSIRALVSVVAMSAGMLVASPASPTQATAIDGSRISVRVSDPTPRVGQEFVVRGLFTYRGAVAAGHTVRLQSYSDGSWNKIVGAHVRTGADGRYRLRVILMVRGVRDLRIVGVVGNGQPNVSRRFVVQVG